MSVFKKEYSLNELELLCLEYPYCMTFRTEYLAQLKRSGDIRYVPSLRVAAISSASRQRLFEYLESEVSQTVPASSAEIPETTVVPQTVEQSNKESAIPTKRERPVVPVQFDILAELEKLPVTENSAPMQDNDIIDKFLSNPRTKISLDSKVEDENEDTRIVPVQQSPQDEPFSETLAKIYIKQHKYEKAIKTFQRLITKYPEKSVYFADQIRFLQKLIDNL